MIEKTKQKDKWIDKAVAILSLSKQYLVYGLIGISLVFYYLANLGIAPSFTASLLPLAVAASFFLVLEILLSIEQKVRSISAPETFPNLLEAFVRLKELLTKRNRRPREMHVIASTGGSSYEIVNNLAKISRNLNIRLLILDEDTPEIDTYALHWKRECQEIKRKIEQLQQDPNIRGRGITIDFRTYRHIPMMKGFLIDDRYLLAGFYLWAQDGTTKQLVGSDNPYFYCSTDDPTGESLYPAFKGWFEYDWNNAQTKNTPIASLSLD